MENNFKVIKGGISENLEELKPSFISSYVTDTRLMGTVVLHIHWKIISVNIYDFHQFFYCDSTEEGLETYKSLIGNDFANIKALENSLLGGLGSAKIPLSENEARFLLCNYSKINLENNKPLPDQKHEYNFLLDEKAFSSMIETEKKATILKTCTPLLSEYHTINYFLMRAFAKDTEALEFLAIDSCSIENYLDNPASELCKNTIELFQNEKEVSYVCESLVEENERYKITISELILETNYKVKSAKILSYFFVTPAEASMMMAKAEYVTCYDIVDTEDILPEQSYRNFVELFRDYARNSLATEHDDCSLYIIFNDNNLHVNQSEFRINDDLHCIYYISNFDQLIVTAYKSQIIKETELALEKSQIGKYLLPLCKYKFKEPMVYEFIQSDFDNFEEFVEAVLYHDDQDE